MARHVDAIPMDGVRPKPIRMLNEWLPFACGMTLFSGDGETGKSAMAIKLAAQATRGTCGGFLKDPIDVGFILTEDDWDKVSGRLMASGADMGRVHCFVSFNDANPDIRDKTVDLTKDMALARAACAQYGIKLLVIDALAECMGDIDQNQHGPVSRVPRVSASGARRMAWKSSDCTTTARGDKERTLPVPTRLASELRHRPVGWLFPGGAEGYCGVDFVAKRIRTATGWPSHSLRRQFATVSYYRSGCNIVLVSRMRGRSNIATTMRYIGLVQNEMRTTIEATARTDMHTDRITNAFIGKVS